MIRTFDFSIILSLIYSLQSEGMSIMFIGTTFPKDFNVI